MFSVACAVAFIVPAIPAIVLDSESLGVVAILWVFLLPSIGAFVVLHAKRFKLHARWSHIVYLSSVTIVSTCWFLAWLFAPEGGLALFFFAEHTLAAIAVYAYLWIASAL